MAKKVEHKHELLENPDAIKETLVGAETWVEKNSKTVIGIVAVILVGLAGYFGFNYYTGVQNVEAQKEMFQAIYYFEQDSLEQALNGDGNNLGFINIVEDYGMTEAANLSNYYAGVCYLKQGKFEVARLYLEDFSSKDLLVQARAYSLIGDTFMEENKFEDAAQYYNKAANYKANKYFSPAYLMKEALAYEKLNENDKAIAVYETVISQYAESAEYQNARKYLAKLQTNS